MIDGRRAGFRNGTIVLALSALALAIRVILASRSGLWRDEGLFLFVARSESWMSVLDFLRFSESHPPFFYAVMRAWMSIAGQSEAAARVIPIALGVALVPAMYLVASSLFSVRVGLLAAALVALSPSLAEHSVLVRPYSLLPLLALLSGYTLVRGLERGERRAWVAHALTTLAIVYTHNWGLLVLGGQWMAALAVLFRSVTERRALAQRSWLITQLVIVACYLPWVPTLVHQGRNAGHAPLSLDGLADTAAFVFTALSSFLRATLVGYVPLNDSEASASAATAFGVLLILLLAVAAALWMREFRTGHRRSMVSTGVPGRSAANEQLYGIPLIVLVATPVAAFLAALVLSPRSNLVLTRCLVTLAPLLLLALAFWLGRPRSAALTGISFAAAAALAATYGSALYTLDGMSRSNAREMAAAVAVRTQPSDLVIIAPEWLASSFNIYYEPTVEQINFPHFGREGAISHSGVRARTADPATLSRVKRRVSQARSEGRRVWLITERDAVLEIAPEEVAAALQSRSYGFVGIVRANQIRAELLTWYGPPDTSVTAKTLPTRFEHFRALLFTAGAAPE